MLACNKKTVTNGIKGKTIFTNKKDLEDNTFFQSLDDKFTIDIAQFSDGSSDHKKS